MAFFLPLTSVLVLAAGGPVREVRLVMGTTAEVSAFGLREVPPALDSAFAALDLVDRRLSLWRESELVALNRSGRAVVSPELRAVLNHALEVAAASKGAFDPTVEPLVRAAGHLGGNPRRLRRCERRSLLARVGWERVHLDAATSSVRLEPGTRLDLGGIAKGFAVDLALGALRGAGPTSGLVDLGGSSLAGFGAPLVLEVRDPSSGRAPPLASFEVKDGAVGTSGGDERPGHIVDPRTGRPARRVLSATVVASSGMEADALSTALYVMGEEGLALVRERGASGFVLLRRRGRSLIRTTPGFAARHGLVAAPGVDVEP